MKGTLMARMDCVTRKRCKSFMRLRVDCVAGKAGDKIRCDKNAGHDGFHGTIVGRLTWTKGGNGY
jgi:hypothetical protein